MHSRVTIFIFFLSLFLFVFSIFKVRPPGDDAVVGGNGKLKDAVDDTQRRVQAVKNLVQDGALLHAHDAKGKKKRKEKKRRKREKDIYFND